MIDTSTMEQPPQVAGKTLNVLLVDDNPTDLKLAMIYLGKAWPFSSDMAVATAADGLEALELMRTKRFCLIILDWCLPQGGNGHVLREIRRNGVFIPVVVMSGLARDQLPDYLESAGAAYVNKDNLNAPRCTAPLRRPSAIVNRSIGRPVCWRMKRARSCSIRMIRW